MTPRLVGAEYLREYKIRVTFDDGKAGVLDLEDELWGEVFEPLRDIRLFRSFTFDAELGTVVWPTGADLAPEYLYENAVAGNRRVSTSNPTDSETIHRIRFPEPLKAAIRDRRLVVFAGAGVSMGEPAGLPNFETLACRIAEGTGAKLESDETVDQFLGRLRQSGTNVHDLAARELSRDNLAPTELHRDLLRLYPDAAHMRIVTTNFDLLFELAAQRLFPTTPETFRAPALPLGHDFSGIVHVHGAVGQPKQMVLTDADFGRAYLTEGWARRFLTGLFREFTVLFVGFGHNDTVMRYLVRALPESQPGKRFALMPQLDVDPQRRKLFGIETIPYRQVSRPDHRTLSREVHRLADHVSRSVLDWQREITELAAKPRPIGGDETDIIEEALEDPVKTRFFTKAARLPEWIEWLNEREKLGALFNDSDLGERDKILAEWLAKQFAHDHAGELFSLIAQHRMHLHPYFWHELGRKIGLNEQSLPKKELLSQWISLLITTAPRDRHDFVFLWLGQQCQNHGTVEDLLSIFNAMAESHLVLKPAYRLPDLDRSGPQSPIRVETYFSDDHFSMNELWEGLKPSLAQVAEPLLKRISRRLEDQHLKLSAWQVASREWDPTSYDRSAIEPHEQDEFPEAVDVLIDAARDCLEWLADNDTQAAALWCDQLAGSDVPVLRRLAVHTLYARQDIVPDEKIDWLLEKANIYDIAAHHEVFRMAQNAFPESSAEKRRTFVDAVLAYRWPNADDPKKEMYTAQYHFDWLDWLHRAAPDCQLAKSALRNLSVQYPMCKPREHPDFAHWIGVGGGSFSHQSPWTVEELLKHQPFEWLPRLLSFEQTEFDGPDRVGLLHAVEDATKEHFEWGYGLAQALADKKQWDSDLWAATTRGWSNMKLNESRHRAVLDRLGSVELYGKQANGIAENLYSLVKDGGRPYALNVLTQANTIASDLWQYVGQEEPPKEIDDWFTTAINRPAGKLAEFWLHSLSIWQKQKDFAPGGSTEEYLVALSQIIQDRSRSGRLGRAVFAAHFSFLAAVDEAWTRENVLPLFYARDDVGDFQTAWHSFLKWGRLGPTSAELLAPAFFKAVPKIRMELSGCRDRFVGHYVSMIVYFVENPIREWIPTLFQHADNDVKENFAMTVSDCLRSMDDAQQLQQWNRWLKAYWTGRLQGKPVPLEPDETRVMLGWLPALQAVFSEAVDCAVQMPVRQSDLSTLIYEFDTKEIWRRYPEEVARLLIHLGKSRVPGYMWYGGRKLVDKLLDTDLSPAREQGLKELIATLDLT